MKSLSLLFLLVGIGSIVFSDTLKAERVDRLYAEADFVGFVQVLSGEFKEYTGAVYRGKILNVLKGSTDETEIYFGPFSGYGIGSEYLLFARKTDKTLDGHWSQADRPMIPLHYPSAAPYFTIMFEGFGMMPVQYVVGLDGSGIEIASHIKLPTTLKDNIVRSENRDWISKNTLAKYLESLGKNTTKKIR